MATSNGKISQAIKRGAARVKKAAHAAKKRVNRKRPRKNKEGIFGAAAVARAKKVQPVARVQEKDTGELGTVTFIKGTYLKVKWDGRTRPTLIRASMVRGVNPAGRKAHQVARNSSDSSVRSPTSTSSDVRSPTRTSTKAHTSGNVTVTGGAGAGATTTVKITQAKKNPTKKRLPTITEIKESIAHRERQIAHLLKEAKGGPLLHGRDLWMRDYKSSLKRLRADLAKRRKSNPHTKKAQAAAIAFDKRQMALMGYTANPKKAKRTIVRAKVIKKVVINPRMPYAVADYEDKDRREPIIERFKTLREAEAFARDWSRNYGHVTIWKGTKKVRTIDVNKNPRKGRTARRAGGVASGQARAIKAFKAMTGGKRERHIPPKGGATNKRNPPAKRSGGSVRKEFLGRWPTRVVKVQASRFMPQKPRPDILGRVEEIKVKGHGIIKMPRTSKLISTAGKKLWISERVAKPNPAGDKDTVHPLGELQHVVYHAHKSPKVDSLGQTHFGEDRRVAYIHKMGEDSGKRPMAYVDHDGFLVLKGGGYTIDWRGIID